MGREPLANVGSSLRSVLIVVMLILVLLIALAVYYTATHWDE